MLLITCLPNIYKMAGWFSLILLLSIFKNVSFSKCFWNCSHRPATNQATITWKSIHSTDRWTKYYNSVFLQQENTIITMEMRSYFSLLCLHQETQMVFTHLPLVTSILGTFVHSQIQGHKEVHFQWHNSSITSTDYFSSSTLFTLRTVHLHSSDGWCVGWTSSETEGSVWER